MFGMAWLTSVVIGVREDRGREEQRSSLTRRPGDRQDCSRDNAAECSRKDDPEHRAPATDTQRQAGLAQCGRDEQQHLLRGTRNEWKHHDRKPDGAGETALLVTNDEQAVDEDSDDDRRKAGHDVDHELDGSAELLRREFGQVDRRENPDRQGDHRRESHDDHRPDDGIGNAATRAAEQIRLARQKVPAEGRSALPHDRDDHNHEHRHGEQAPPGCRASPSLG